LLGGKRLSLPRLSRFWRPHETWERLEKSGSRLARPAYSRVMREVVAKRIMEMAGRGVQDREALITDAVRFIAANYEQPGELAK
jgi:hypothetical protein